MLIAIRLMNSNCNCKPHCNSDDNCDWICFTNAGNCISSGHILQIAIAIRFLWKFKMQFKLQLQWQF
jgi:hypothetical protein